LQKEELEMSIEQPVSSIDHIGLPNAAPSTSRRSFLAGAGGAAVALLGGGLTRLDNPLVGDALAADTGCPPATFAPLPAGALGPQLNAEGYFVGRISGDLYWVTDSVYIAMFLTTRHGVVLVDAPPSIGHNLLRAISAVTEANGRPSRVTHLVYSHSHADHTGASFLFGSDVVRVGHRICRELMLRDNDPHRPPPTVTFDDHHVLSVGGEQLHLDYHGPNHSPDNIFIHLPDHDTLMLVDIVNPGWVPIYQSNLTEDIPGYLDAPALALESAWKQYVGGHVGRLGTRADITLHQQYMADVDASIRTTLATLDPTPFFVKYGANGWAATRGYLDAVADTAAVPVIEKYTGVLAAADVFTASTAFQVMQSIRLDLGAALFVHP